MWAVLDQLLKDFTVISLFSKEKDGRQFFDMIFRSPSSKARTVRTIRHQRGILLPEPFQHLHLTLKRAGLAAGLHDSLPGVIVGGCNQNRKLHGHLLFHITLLPCRERMYSSGMEDLPSCQNADSTIFIIDPGDRRDY